MITSGRRLVFLMIVMLVMNGSNNLWKHASMYVLTWTLKYSSLNEMR